MSIRLKEHKILENLISNLTFHFVINENVFKVIEKFQQLDGT